MNRLVMLSCVLGVSGVSLLAGAPAYAADGASGEANAITATVPGTSFDSGRVVATHDGTTLQKTGTSTPPLSVLGGQDVVSEGFLGQDATAGADGTSAACAGVAGDGASLVAIGETGCINPGERNVHLELATLDLSTLLAIEPIADSGSLGALLDTILVGPLAGAEAPILAALNDGLTQTRQQLGDAGLALDADVIEVVCTAEPGSAEGTSFLSDVGVSLSSTALSPTPIPLSTAEDFAPEPAPNTKVLTDLDEVLPLLLDELAASMADELGGLVIDLDGLVTPLVEAALEQVEGPVLTQLEKNILDITLNRQSDDGSDGSIEVTAVAVSLLPAAGELGASVDPLASLDVANVGCGPMAGAPTGGDDTSGGGDGTTPVTDTDGNPVPTTVNAGVEDAGQGGLLASLAALLGLGVVARLLARRPSEG